MNTSTLREAPLTMSDALLTSSSNSTPFNIRPSTARTIRVIANPTAGSAKQRRLRRAVRYLEELGCRVDVVFTEAAGHAIELAEKAAASGEVDVVVAAGGDGTINEVANGLARAGVHTVSLGIIPLGTANVLAIEAGIPRTMEEAAKIIATGSARSLYLGQIHAANDTDGDVRHFVMMAGAGFDAHVVNTLDLGLKRRVGKLAYVWSTLRRAFTYSYPLCDVELETPDGGVTRLKSATVVVCNGRHYGGSFVAAPLANISKPTFEVVVLTRPGPVNLLRYIWGLGAGRLSHFNDVQVLEATRIRVHDGLTHSFQVDGDALASSVTEIMMGRHPLSLIVPTAGVGAAA